MHNKSRKHTYIEHNRYNVIVTSPQCYIVESTEQTNILAKLKKRHLEN